MRFCFTVLVAALGACTFAPGSPTSSVPDAGTTGDASQVDAVLPVDAAELPPRRIVGGGIGDGPIAGRLHVHVVHAYTDVPIADAMVTVGVETRPTGANGLVTFARADLVGKQTIVVRAEGFRAEMWIGVAGGNATMPLIPMSFEPARGTLQGAAPYTAPPVGARFYNRTVTVASESGLFGDNVTGGVLARDTCNSRVEATCGFSISSHVGRRAVISALYDVDDRGDGTGSNDRETLAGWALQRDVDVAPGQIVGTLQTVRVPAVDIVTFTAMFSPPADYGGFGIVGLELGDEGVAQMIAVVIESNNTLIVPSLAYLGSGATYRFSGLLAGPNGASSTVIRRGITQLGVDLAGQWLVAPANVATTAKTVSFAPVTGASFHIIGVRASTEEGAPNVLGCVIFDDTTTVTIPEGVLAPGAHPAIVGAVRVPMLDVANYETRAVRERGDGYVTAGAVNVVVP